MKKQVKCESCKKTINLSKDKYVLLGTYKGNKILEENFFHFDCFRKWFNRKIKEGVEKKLTMARNVATKGPDFLKKLGVNIKDLQYSFEGALGEEDVKTKIPNFLEAIGLIKKNLKDEKKRKRVKKNPKK